MEQFFFGVHRPRIVLYISIFSNGFNILANYVLIFGKWGFPAMGLEGAAIGSVIAWGLHFFVLLAAFLAPAMRRKFKTHMVRVVRWRQCRDLLKLGWPSGVQFCNDILSWGFGVIILAGVFGIAHRAASTIVMRYLGISFMPTVGIGIAVTAVVGKAIGEGKPDLARHRTHVALVVAVVYMGVCGVVFWLFRHEMVDVFITHVDLSGMTGEEVARLSTEIHQAGSNILICAALFQVLDAFCIIYIGALRGAGDTLWPMVVMILTSWLIIIGGGILMVNFVPSLTSVGPWIAVRVYLGGI